MCTSMSPVIIRHRSSGFARIRHQKRMGWVNSKVRKRYTPSAVIIFIFFYLSNLSVFHLSDGVSRVGVGALGGTIATRAISGGMPVWLAARTGAAARALRSSGLRVTGVGLAKALSPPVTEQGLEAHPQRFQTTCKPHLSKARFLASLLLPDFDRWRHYRNTAELHRKAGLRRVAPFIPTQALRLWVGYSRRWRISRRSRSVPLFYVRRLRKRRLHIV